MGVINMKSAKEMREITENVGRVVDNAVKEILNQALINAENGESTLKYRGHGFSSSEMYLYNRFTPTQEKIVSKLKNLGYEAHISKEEFQFADIYLKVSW